MATGTAANGLALACLSPAWGEVFCHRDSHVMTDECGGPEHWTGGAKLTPLEGVGGKVLPATLAAALEVPRRGIHSVAPSALSLTNLTECGTALYGGGDGGRWRRSRRSMASTCISTARASRTRWSAADPRPGKPATPADLTWKAGVDVLCLGATKNGAMAAEAVIFFDPALAETAAHRRMRGGHLLSKGRLLSSQFMGWLKDDHWLGLARKANAAARLLAEGVRRTNAMRLAWPVDGNEAFIVMPEATEQKLLAQGFRFYRWRAESMAEDERPAAGEVLCRFVCSWQTEEAAVDAFLAAASKAAA